VNAEFIDKSATTPGKEGLQIQLLIIYDVIKISGDVPISLT
jgi:hypothetical protein